LRAASTDRKFDPIILARPPQLRRLRADSGLAGFARWSILPSGRSIRNARYGNNVAGF
jgi:hypothetical protein